MDGNNKLIKSVKDITLVAIMAGILFAQEQLLVFLPNFQLTAFLIILFSKKFGFFKTTLIIFIYVLLDNLYMGSFNIVFTPFVFLGWMLFPIFYCTILKKNDSPLILALTSIIFSFTYCWIYIIPNLIAYNIDPFAYLLSDIVFEIIFVVCNFILVLLLYKPCSKLLDNIYKENI